MTKLAGKSLPALLRIYEDSDFGLQERARFFYNLMIIMAVGMTIVMIYTSIIQLIGPDFGHFYFPVLITEILLLLLILCSLFLLIKGKFRFSTHMLIGSSILSVWTVMFLDKSSVLVRFDTIIYIFAVLSMLPLMLHRGRIALLIYGAANMLLLVIFILIAGKQLNLPSSVKIEYFFDVMIPATFVVIVGYNIFNINRKSLERTVTDIRERHEAEKALLESEKKYRTLFEQAQIGIYQTTPEGEILNANPAIIKMLGFDSLDELKKINLESEEINLNAERLKFKELIERKGNIRNIESIWRKKNGEEINILENARAVLNADGKILYYDGFVENITERKRAEKALIESQQQFQTLSHMSPVGIFRTNTVGYTTYVNPKWVEISGLSMEEALGDGWIKAVHPDDRENLSRNWREMLSHGEKSIAEYRFIKPDGSITWVLGNAVPEILDGELKGYIGTVTNITDIKNSQAKLENSEKRFRDLADLLPQTVWEAALDGRMSFINKHGLMIYGYTEEEMTGGASLLTFLVPEDRERALINIQKILNNGTGVISSNEYISVKKDGSTFPIRPYVSAIYENQKPVGLRGITFDLTDIKLAEKELKESEARYRSIIDAFPDIIMISDLNGNIIYGNEPFHKITGIEITDYTNKKRKPRIHPDDFHMVSSATWDLVNTDKKHTDIIENRFIDKWDNVHWLSGIISKIVLNGQIMLQTITRDITEKKNIELELEKYRNRLELLVTERTEELEAANEELVTTNETLIEQHEKLETTLMNLQQAQKQLVLSEKMASLGILAAGVAHEINNPLNFIQGGIIAIENYINENLADHLLEIEPLLGGMAEGVNRASTIVTSLNHYSRYDEGPMEEGNIHAILDNCLIMLQNKTRGRIEILKEYTDSEYILECNEGRMHQAFLNILSNAVQSIRNEGKIVIKTSIEGGNLEVSVSDTGCGISEENLPRIFDPFFTTREPGKGTGLGLAITYNIINEHNGKIICHSKMNEGTVFFVTLPVKI